jgi:predicted N-formylglutamate amidohydrolase
MHQESHSLLAPDEPPAVTVERPQGSSHFLFVVDHASHRIPRRLGALGLAAADLERHIAWDIGAAAVAHDLSARFDATTVLQGYSRLVIDCNRDPMVQTSIPEISEHTPIPGNQGLSRAERVARAQAVFWPYHDRIAGLVGERIAAGRPVVLVAVHSFTPVFKYAERPWHVGVLYNRDARLARPMMALLREDGELSVGDNEPYAVSDTNDYTIPVHGERRGVPHVELEIRQDLVAEPHGQQAWAARLADLLPRALERAEDG